VHPSVISAKFQAMAVGARHAATPL